MTQPNEFPRSSVVWLEHPTNLVPRTFSSFKMAVGETPGQGCQNGSKYSWEFCHVEHDEMPSFCLNNCFRFQENKQGCQTLETTSEKTHFIMCHVTKYSTILGVFQQSFSDRHFEWGEDPGVEVARCYAGFRQKWEKRKKLIVLPHRDYVQHSRNLTPIVRDIVLIVWTLNINTQGNCSEKLALYDTFPSLFINLHKV